MSPKTILFLIPTLCDRGAERVLVNLANNLDNDQYDITLQTLFNVGTHRKALKKTVHYRPGLPFLFRGNVTLMKLFTPRLLYRWIVGKRYDIVVAFLEGPATRIIAGCPYANSKRIAWVHVEQQSAERASASFRTYQEAVDCYRTYNRIAAVSESVKRDFESLLPFKCDVVRNVIDEAQIRLLSKQSISDDIFSSGVNVISIGKLEYQKGYDRLVRIHRRLLDQGLFHHIYILGSGSQENVILSAIKELKVSDTFHLLGAHTNPYPYILKADLYVCSSRYEGMSTSVTEALVLGIPVVSTDCGGARELLGENNEYGLVTDNDEESLCMGLSQMLKNKEFIDSYKNRKSFTRFSKEELVQKVSEYLHNATTF